MNWIVWLLLVTTIVFLSLAVFLGKEILKKFRLFDQFMTEQSISSSGYIKKVYFDWTGEKKKGMRNIALEADCPFKVLVGFRLKIPLLHFEGTDWFGVGSSKRDRGTDYVIISTFLWKKPVEFCFYIKSLNPEVHVKVVPPQFATAKLKADIVCPPHIYQRLGFYA